jgi:hypothetical protein
MENVTMEQPDDLEQFLYAKANAKNEMDFDFANQNFLTFKRSYNINKFNFRIFYIYFCLCVFKITIKHFC